MAYVIIRTETKEDAVNLRNLIKSVIDTDGTTLNIMDGEDIFYNTQNICEDISEVVGLKNIEEDE